MHVLCYLKASHYMSIVPAPNFISITSDPVSPIHPVGATVTLTCTVVLSSAVDVRITLSTVWTGPNGYIMTTNNLQPVLGSTTTYTSIAMVNSIGRAESGIYTCTATVSSTNEFVMNNTVFEEAQITTGKSQQH